MANFHILIPKLIKGIRYKHGVTLLLVQEDKISEKTGNVYTEYRVYLGMGVEKYNEIHPNDAKNPKVHKSKYATRLLYKTVKREEMFLFIYNEIWKPLESGEMYEKGREAAERIRSRYYPNRGKGASGSAGVLQDAQVSEELSGSLSGSEQQGSYGSGEGDIVEAE